MGTPDAKRIARGLWWDRAWSLVEGCTPVSSGCDHCWSAEQTHIRAHQTNLTIRARYEGLIGSGGQFCGKIRLMYSDLEKPLRVRKPTSWAVWNDLFHKDVPFDFIDRVQLTKLLCPQHTFLTLTKRPKRMAEYYAGQWYRRVVNLDRFDQLNRERLDHADDAMQRAMGRSFGAITCGPHESRFLPNDFLGTTAENQAMADLRIPHLLKCPAVRFVSFEPLLEPVDPKESWEPDRMYCQQCGHIAEEDATYFSDDGPDDSWPICPECGNTNLGGYQSYAPMGVIPLADRPFPPINWAVIGCESGPKQRPFQNEWAFHLAEQCKAAGTPVFVKQLRDENKKVVHGPAEWDGWPKWATQDFPIQESKA